MDYIQIQLGRTSTGYVNADHVPSVVKGANLPQSNNLLFKARSSLQDTLLYIASAFVRFLLIKRCRD